MIQKVRKQFSNWNKKTTINIGNNKQYKIVGSGNSAFKVLKFEPQEELNNEGGWSQVFWKYQKIKPDTTAYKVIMKMEQIMSGQTTL